MDSDAASVVQVPGEQIAEAPEEEVPFTMDAAGETDARVAEALSEQAAEAAEEELLFTLDAIGDTDASVEAPAEQVAEAAGEAEAAEVSTALCTQCGLVGHEESACPFAHPEDIDLGDLEESDSDDELAELYPLFSRYVQQHVGALTPKDRKGLTGGGRYFGQEKQQACWACAEVGHDATACPDKGCFFCSKKGHESRECPQRALRCSHCQLRGHAPVECPSLAAQRLADFSHVRCMRCGSMGHPNCGAGVMPPAMSVQVNMRQEADKQQMLQQIAAGRARERAWDTAPWRSSKRPAELPGSRPKLAKAMPAPDLSLTDD
ncbi:unnamed protein product [Effrenium voratum]|nr:unnamed protein product [Effrenium voratum]